MDKIKLTQTVKKGGCAAKLAAGSLRDLLSSLHFNKPPELSVSAQSMDDACLWDLGDGRYQISTLDFFTPIVDDPYDFGAVAAANALSDIFAMGGEPKVALTILAFPTAHLDLAILKPLMQGALDKIHEAGASLAGGHSIDDDTLKLGFSVNGFVDKEKAWTNAGARPGDKLILTKPLGTGVIVSALKLEQGSSEAEAEAIKSMTRLNDLSPIKEQLNITAATDITGFGLAGHALNIARESNVTIELNMAEVAGLATARDLLGQGIRNKAHHSNLHYLKDQGARFSCADDDPNYWLACDPQTSGGLLLAVPAKDCPKSLELIRELFPQASVVGEVTKKSSHAVVVQD